VRCREKQHLDVREAMQREHIANEQKYSQAVRELQVKVGLIVTCLSAAVLCQTDCIYIYIYCVVLRIVKARIFLTAEGICGGVCNTSSTLAAVQCIVIGPVCLWVWVCVLVGLLP